MSILPFSEQYRQWRRQYYQRFPDFWGTIDGVTEEEYAVLGALSVSEELAHSLQLAAARLFHLMGRLASVLQQQGDEVLSGLGFPASSLAYCRTQIPEMPAVMCGRYEFVMTAEGPRLLEFNAETPTFVVELFHMNSQICADFGLPDPNAHARQQLSEAIERCVLAGLNWVTPAEELPLVVFSAFADRFEERGTTEFYWQQLKERQDLPFRTAFLDLGDLRVTSEGLFTAQGERISVLYKLYPTEFLMDDTSPDGTPVGLSLMELVRQQKLAVINPPISFMLQNKALVALLWALHLSQSPLFNEEEHSWIAQYVLPTYFEAGSEDGTPYFSGTYVVKPVYGREGASVSIRDAQEVIEQSPEDSYNEQIMIYQQYAPLPTTTILTEQGLSEVNLVHNCFIVGGEPSAIGVRAARKRIFDDNSYFLPVCLDLGPLTTPEEG